MVYFKVKVPVDLLFHTEESTLRQTALLAVLVYKCASRMRLSLQQTLR